MPQYVHTIYDSLKAFMPYYVVSFIAIELLILKIIKAYINRSEYIINIISGVIIVVTQSLFQLLLLKQINPWLYEHRFINIPNYTLAFILCFIVYSFLQYFTHFLSHKVRVFWCLHEVHHSSTDITIASGIRNSIFDLISTDVFYFIIPLLGFEPMIYFIVYTTSKIWGTFIHINHHLVNELPLINAIIVDPKTHHLHHARNKMYIDKNFCETITLYDKLFGTFARETETPVYGSSNNPNPSGFWNVHTNEFKLLFRDVKTATSTWNALKYIFYPPGWQPIK
ncbi:MAG: sterol desaturase family protein [Chitinophagaceae bacterium]